MSLGPGSRIGPYEVVGERRYDVAPDGRFLLVAPTAAPAQTPFMVVVNWTAALR